MTAYPSFPRLSRAPSLETVETTIDPTLRDPMENGMETTRARFTRRRRTWTGSRKALTPADKDRLDRFVQNIAVYGANIFLYRDNRDRRNPQTYMVRFSVLPRWSDAGWVEGEYRQNLTFEIREV